MANFSSYHIGPAIYISSVGSTGVVLLAVHVATTQVQMYTDLSNKPFSAKTCCKVVFKSVKILEAIVFHSDPYYEVLPYLMICNRNLKLVCSYLMMSQ